MYLFQRQIVCYKAGLQPMLVKQQLKMIIFAVHSFDQLVVLCRLECIVPWDYPKPAVLLNLRCLIQALCRLIVVLEWGMNRLLPFFFFYLHYSFTDFCEARYG